VSILLVLLLVLLVLSKNATVVDSFVSENFSVSVSLCICYGHNSLWTLSLSVLFNTVPMVQILLV